MTAPSDLKSVMFWPTLFFHSFWKEHSTSSAAIIEYLYDLRAKQKHNIDSGVAVKAKSQAGIYESDFNLFDSEHTELQKLKSFIVSTVQQVVSRVNGSTVPPDDLDVKLIDSWYHITNDGGFHDSHYHGNCSWCGIYYLQLGDSGPGGDGAPNGLNRFYSPIPSGMKLEDYGNFYLNNCYLDAPAKDGMLLIFPAFLLHSGLPYRGATDRVIISFNSQSNIRT